VTKTSSEVRADLTPFEFNGKQASWAAMRRLFQDVETALFFAQAVGMNWTKLSELLQGLFHSSVLDALLNGSHSTDLQDYIVDVAPPAVSVQLNKVDWTRDVPHGEILPYMWDAIEIGVAKSIADVAGKLSNVLDSLPGTQGEMTFNTLMQMNRRRPTIGDYKARIQHPHSGKNLVVFDVSGSMSEPTVRAIAGDVVALGVKAKAGLAIVSDTAKYWDPGTFSVDDVLREAEYSGTHYETLAPLFEHQCWDVVVSIADYDSSPAAGRWVRENALGTIEKLLDISLVQQPTYLSEVLGQLAKEVEPMLLSTGAVMRNNRW
jgi:hypothetical protein